MLKITVACCPMFFLFEKHFQEKVYSICATAWVLVCMHVSTFFFSGSNDYSMDMCACV